MHKPCNFGQGCTPHPALSQPIYPNRVYHNCTPTQRHNYCAACVRSPLASGCQAFGGRQSMIGVLLSAALSNRHEVFSSVKTWWHGVPLIPSYSITSLYPEKTTPSCSHHSTPSHTRSVISTSTIGFSTIQSSLVRHSIIESAVIQPALPPLMRLVCAPPIL